MSDQARRIAQSLRSMARNRSHPSGLPVAVRNTNSGDTPNDIGKNPTNVTMTNRDAPMWYENPQHIPVGSDPNTIAGSGNGPKIAGYTVPHPVNGGPVPVTKAQWEAVQLENQIRNPLQARRNAWDMEDPTADWSRYLHPRTWGKGLRNIMRSGDMSFLGDFAKQGPWQGAASYGIPLALAGAVLGGGRDMLTGGSGSAARWGALGGLAGLGFGATSGHLSSKYDGSTKIAYKLPGDTGEAARQEIINKLRGDFSTPPQVTQALINKVMSLESNQAERLGQLVATVGAGAVAAVIAKFLFGAGLLSSALFGIGGATLASNMMRDVDAFGRESTSGYDMYGRKI